MQTTSSGRVAWLATSDGENSYSHWAAQQLRGRSRRARNPPRGEGTVANIDNVFTVFISHKHDDHALAVEVKKALEGLSPGSIECFVSGIDITAGMDWRREIRSVLARSHLLVLLFTSDRKSVV